MKKIKIIISLACGAVFLCGCVGSTFAPMGKDTFIVVHRGEIYSTVGSLKIECLSDANAYCQKKGLVMVPVSTSGHDGGVGVIGECELVFLAVPASDPRNTSPNMERSPDSVKVIKNE
jgi:hypothetical protein